MPETGAEEANVHSVLNFTAGLGTDSYSKIYLPCWAVTTSGRGDAKTRGMAKNSLQHHFWMQVSDFSMDLLQGIPGMIDLSKSYNLPLL